MHLAYFDETGTDGHSSVVMFGALIVPSGKFGGLSGLHETAISQIIPEDKVDDFAEFHASALYHGRPPFDGIDDTKRFTAIQILLQAVHMEGLSFVYAAVDRERVAESPFGITRPLHAAFHMCLLGVEDWATANHPKHPGVPQNTKVIDWNDTYLCILDDCSDNKLKQDFKRTYRTLRTKHPFLDHGANRLWHAHDDMFFVDSTDCLGVQIADLCNYFVRLRLEGKEEKRNFYDLISGQVICAKPEPEWNQYGHLFRAHK